MAIDEAPANPGTARAQLYKWQTWVHVGPDAGNCEDVNEDEGTNECHNPLHFHAWVRLPNPHQWRDIREKALAAKARRMRLMREEGSDLYVITQEEIEGLARRGEAAREQVIDELVQMDWWKHTLSAQRDLMFEREDPDDEESPLRWEHIDEDRARGREIRSLHEDEQPKDELKLIDERVNAFDKAFEEAKLEAARPLREELEALDISALLDRLWDARVGMEGSRFFDVTFGEWEMVTCTYRAIEGESYWFAPPELGRVPEAITEAVQAAFYDLNREKGGVAQGNS